MHIDEILGDYEKRYFGLGHKKTNYFINEIRSEGDEAQGQIWHNSKIWSEKMNIPMTPHLSTVDGLILAIMFVEKIIHRKFKNIKIEELILTFFEIRAGNSPVESFDNIPIRINEVEIHEEYLQFCIDVTGMKIHLKFLIAGIEKITIHNIVESEPYISNHLKNIKHDLKNIIFRNDNSITCEIERDMVEKNYHGIGQNFSYNLSLLEWLIIFSQMAQLLAYNIDSIDRQKSDTLWMRSVKAEIKTIDKDEDYIFATGKVTQKKILSLKNENWRMFSMSGSSIDDNVVFEGNIAHKLPKSKEGSVMSA